MTAAAQAVAASHTAPVAHAARAAFADGWQEPGAQGAADLDDAEADLHRTAADLDGTQADLDDNEADADAASAGDTSAVANAFRTAPTVPPAPDDAQLAAWLTRIADRDERALEALYVATSGRVHGLVLRITQRRSLAEEVVEDTFWQVWRQAARFDAARGRPLTWVLAIARSRAIDALRHDGRFRHDELPSDDALDDRQAVELPPQDLLDATRGAARLHAALARLDARTRQLVGLAFFRGLTHEEIAAREGLPLGTVKSLIRRTLQQLRGLLEESCHV